MYLLLGVAIDYYILTYDFIRDGNGYSVLKYVPATYAVNGVLTTEIDVFNGVKYQCELHASASRLRFCMLVLLPQDWHSSAECKSLRLMIRRQLCTQAS